MIKPEIKALIEKAASYHDLDPNLVLAHVMTESSGNPQATRFEPAFYERYVLPLNLESKEARGRATSFGLLQIMGQVARELGFKGPFSDLLKPEIGLEWGCKKLNRCYSRFGKDDINAGIAAYNCGAPKIKDGKFVNQVYVDRVNGFLKQIKKEK
jgi:soluble lytic murein transglycosylase-like protein